MKHLPNSIVLGILLLIVAITGMTGCINNDLPYPRIQPNFTVFEVKDQLRSAVIDSASRTVTVFLNESADIQSVEILNWDITEGARISESELNNNAIDLSSPVEVVLSLYQDYVWTITAIQEIERYFTVASQIGSSVIDVDAHTVSAMVPTAQPLDDVLVRSIKLAGTTAVMSPDIAGVRTDFSQPVTVRVTEFGRNTDWIITVTQSDVSVDLVRVDAWTNVAWLYGEAEEGKSNGFEYRIAGEQDWTAVPSEWVTHSGGSFVGRLLHLQPLTKYEARAVSDGEGSVEREFTTGALTQLPNSQFQDWWQNGKVWNPWASDGVSFWDTGNKGATTIGQSNTVPIEDPFSSTGYSGAKLESKYLLLKFAAGNLFAGEYVRTVGTNGVLAFGREFTERPTKLTGRLKYQSATINYATSEFNHLKGEPDTCIVWCALGDWDEPYEIRTSTSDRRLFDKNDAGVIAYGQVQYGYSIDDYIDFTVDLEYNSTDRVPKYILVTASASKYGDYFTGGNGSVLCIESVSLQYDY